MRKDIKASCLKRLRRIEGQVGGLSRMVEEDRYCIDIVTQISAVRAALRRAEEEILRDHVAHCVEDAIASGDKAAQRRKGRRTDGCGGSRRPEVIWINRGFRDRSAFRTPVAPSGYLSTCVELVIIQSKASFSEVKPSIRRSWPW